MFCDCPVLPGFFLAIGMNEYQQRQLIDESADKAVKKTFAILGVDIDDPGDVEDFRKDLRFSNQMRSFMDKGQIAFVSGIALAIAAALWAAITGRWID